MLTMLAVHGYRSLREVALELGPLTVVTGANGTGKSSLYRAFSLLSDAARGRLVSSLAHAGGLPSVLWAGPELVSGAMRRGEARVEGTGTRKKPISLALGYASDSLGYIIDVGLPPFDPLAGEGGRSMFFRDPEVKRELIFAGVRLRPSGVLVERKNARLSTRGAAGLADTGVRLDGFDSMLSEAAAPDAHPDVGSVRRQVLSWRFYDSFRTDAASPARQTQVGTRSPVLAGDGGNLASAVQTIRESAWAEPFASTIADAFDGARISVGESLGRFELLMSQPGMLRELEASEWSDGTLRYVLLAAALLSPRPPGLLVLNEPEASLHPEVLPALGRLVRECAERTQVVVVTHSEALVAHLAGPNTVEHELIKRLGETLVAGQGLLTRPDWGWGTR